MSVPKLKKTIVLANVGVSFNEMPECIRNQQAHQSVECDEGHADRQVEQDGSHDAMVSDLSGREHGSGDKT